MPDIHVTRALLEAVSGGHLPPSVLARIGMQHLAEICPTCRCELALFDGRLVEAHLRPLISVDKAVREPARPPPPRLQTRERQRAEALFKELVALSLDERMGRIKRSRGRYLNHALVRLFVDEARRNIPANPQRTYELALVAGELARRMPSRLGNDELQIVARALLGCSRQAMGRNREAEEHFAQCRKLLEILRVGDSLVLAEVDFLEGSLRNAQRRFEEGESLLCRSAALYYLAQELVLTARSLLSLGDLYFSQGSLTRATDTARAALRALDPGAEPRLYLCGRHNLCLYLAEAEQYAAAAEAFDANLPLYEQFPDQWTQLRRSWLEGKIASGLGRDEIAWQALDRARRGFIAMADGCDYAALVSLDLALLYVRQRRPLEVQALAEEMYTVFRAEELNREAALALQSFRQSAAQQGLTVGLVRRIGRRLQEACRASASCDA